MDGFERFAQGQLITLFSATNYCGKHDFSSSFSSSCGSISILFWVCHLGTANNAGAILVVGRGLVVVPKLIHPIPPPLQSPESSPERVMDETWMQVSLLLCTVFNNNWKNAFAKWGNAYELIFCLFLL
jgi:protein phosphatase